MDTHDTQIDMLDLPAETPGESTTSEADTTVKATGYTVTELLKPALEPEFDWFTDDSVVIREQLQTAIYKNRVGAIVVRQEGSGFEPEDQFIILRDAEAVQTLIVALKRELEG
jgi:hypothetical protein